MTRKKNRKKQQPKDLQTLQNNRKIIYTSLVVAGVLAIVISKCSSPEMTEEEANKPINAVFYQNVAQCEADINQQQAEHAVLEKKYQDGQIDKWPTPPPMSAADCAPQMLAAQQEHENTAPIYASLADCQAEGLQCEATPAGTETAGYRPVYGGTYIDPYDEDPNYTYIYYGSSQHRVYETYPVYQSINSGRVVTPYGREISQVTTGRVSVPRHASFSAPSRPTGTSGSGTIRGRSSQGFGSSFKSTGSGGK
jgi:uncharacterized protein YgiB involved in biofilm formation